MGLHICKASMNSQWITCDYEYFILSSSLKICSFTDPTVVKFFLRTRVLSWLKSFEAVHLLHSLFCALSNMHQFLHILNLFWTKNCWLWNIITLSLLVSNSRTMGNREKAEHRKFHTNARNYFFTVRVTEEQAAQRGCGVSLSRDIQDPAGWPAAGNLL